MPILSALPHLSIFIGKLVLDELLDVSLAGRLGLLKATQPEAELIDRDNRDRNPSATEVQRTYPAEITTPCIGTGKGSVRASPPRAPSVVPCAGGEGLGLHGRRVRMH